MTPPWPIRAFAVLFVVQGLIAFAVAMADVPRAQAGWAATFPDLTVTRDFAIVASSARLSIVLIPVALAWWRRARLVRWLVPAMVALRLLLARSGMPAAEWLTLALALAAAACLFTPGARRWFARASAAP
ncbi:hypothetical protein [Croceibacterium ferulae]|uniref:hypothetical protein n=1 Tax=Croceibacterium ferulae TaxID=1854641 RepID=UPI000F87DC49|nr:hypothetical protein [Croceibacterium ferulae]